MKRINQLNISNALRSSSSEANKEKAALIHRAWQTLKSRVSLKLNSAILCGVMRQARDYYCIDCGKRAECYDHRDYEKPFKVDPVCKSCNSRRGSAKQVFIDWRKWDALGRKILKARGTYNDFFVSHAKLRAGASNKNTYKPSSIYKNRYGKRV